MNRCAAAILCFIAVVALMNLARASSLFAAPDAQSTLAAATLTPTDEPPKPPYVFPTPIFIPTYPGDTPSAPVALRTPGQPTGQTTYIVQSGDSPWVIAQNVYGNGSKYPLIMSANGLTDSTRLRVGMTLKIPPLEGAQTPSPAQTPAAVEPTSLTPAAAATSPISGGVSATPAATLAPTPARAGPGNAFFLARAAINILAGLLVIGAFVAAILAFLIYFRTRRMQESNSPKKRLQIRQ